MDQEQYGDFNMTGAETCSVCKRLDSVMFIYIDFQDLLRSVQRCSVCAFMRNLVYSRCVDDEKKDDIDHIALFPNPCGIDVRMDIWYSDHKLAAFGIYILQDITGSATIRTQSLLPLIKPRNHAQEDASSPICLNLAKVWYEECCTSHDSCMASNEAPSPTRLIKIEGTQHDWTVRLIEHPSAGTKYAALSHRWNDSILKTTTGNRLSMLEGVAHSSLPATFRDAITICTFLNIPFLWIDSLCILQDDQADWQSESAHMADVYENATLVIAASATTDGILIPRPDNFVSSHIYRDGGSSLEVFVGPLIYHDHDLGGQEPLVERGWTMQERLLAHRFLSFTKTEIYWECQSISMCECTSGISNESQVRRLTMTDMLNECEEELHTNWFHNVVHHYSGRKLTKASDKLPAISAVARRFASRLSGRYLAGLWEGDLLNGLAWHRYGETSGPYDNQIPSTYRAPSWSWASINSSCTGLGIWNLSAIRGCSTIIDVQCNLATLDNFGAVKSGAITLRGPLAECWMSFPADKKLRYFDSNLYTVNHEKSTEHRRFSTDAPLELAASINFQGEYVNEVHRTNFAYEKSELFAWGEQPPDNNALAYPENIAKVWCLRILENYALVLGHSKDSPDKFVRLGIYGYSLSELGKGGIEMLFENSAISTITIV